jgi:choice-of-anchor A domain-containing protein
MRRIALLALAIPLIGIAVRPASAADLTAAEMLDQFNAIVLGNFTSTSDVEGRTIIGGNMTGGATFYNSPSPYSAPSTFGALNVYGNISSGNYNMNNGGSVTVGGTNDGRFNFNGGGHLTNSVAFTPAQLSAPMTALSAQLANLAANSYLPTLASLHGNLNNVVVTATPVNGLAVFNITGAEANEFASFTINLNGATTVIFNVDTPTGSFIYSGTNDENATSVARNVIFNMYNATSVTNDAEIGGTVLAPYATFSIQNAIDGTLVAQNFSGNGELRDYPFAGTLPSATPAPEPSTIAVLGVGLFGLRCARSRRTA